MDSLRDSPGDRIGTVRMTWDDMDNKTEPPILAHEDQEILGGINTLLGVAGSAARG